MNVLCERIWLQRNFELLLRWMSEAYKKNHTKLNQKVSEKLNYFMTQSYVFSRLGQSTIEVKKLECTKLLNVECVLKNKCKWGWRIIFKIFFQSRAYKNQITILQALAQIGWFVFE
jgi:hypothetical protein